MHYFGTFAAFRATIFVSIVVPVLAGSGIIARAPIFDHIRILFLRRLLPIVLQGIPIIMWIRFISIISSQNPSLQYCTGGSSLPLLRP